MGGATSSKLYPHGTHARYVLNRCRCDECKAALRAYSKRRSLWDREFPYLPPPLVDPKPARAHVRKLMRAGMGYKRIAQVAGVNPKTVYILATGKRKDRKAKRMRRESAEKILAVDLDLAGGQMVDSTEAKAIIAELVGRGWAKAEIGRRVHGPQAKALQVARNGMVTVAALATLRELLTEPVPLRNYSRGKAGTKAMPVRNGKRPAPVPATTIGVTIPERKATIGEVVVDLMRDGGWWTINRIEFEIGHGRELESIRKAIARLYERGALTRREKQLKQGSTFEYRLVD